MCIYVDKIVVSFFATDDNDCHYGINDIRYCPHCKICKSIELFKSHNKNKEYNKICRRCLDSMSRYIFLPTLTSKPHERRSG